MRHHGHAGILAHASQQIFERGFVPLRRNRLEVTTANKFLVEARYQVDVVTAA
jgi:hypothetical protein